MFQMFAAVCFRFVSQTWAKILKSANVIPWRHFWIAHASFWQGNLLLTDMLQRDLLFNRTVTVSNAKDATTGPPCWPGSYQRYWAHSASFWTLTLDPGPWAMGDICALFRRILGLLIEITQEKTVAGNKTTGYRGGGRSLLWLGFSWSCSRFPKKLHDISQKVAQKNSEVAQEKQNCVALFLHLV